MFSRNKKQHSSSRPPSRYVKITLENIKELLLIEKKYKGGVDTNTLCDTIDDICAYVLGDADHKIRLPAPVLDPDDRYHFIFPEGARVRSRPPSESSRTSRHSNRSFHSRARSVASSTGCVFNIGFAPDERDERDEDDGNNDIYIPPRSFNKPRKNSVSSTIKVNGTPMKPSPSLEKMFSATSVSGGGANSVRSKDDSSIDSDSDVSTVDDTLKPRPVFSQRQHTTGTSSTLHSQSPNLKTDFRKSKIVNVGFAE